MLTLLVCTVIFFSQYFLYWFFFAKETKNYFMNFVKTSKFDVWIHCSSLQIQKSFHKKTSDQKRDLFKSNLSDPIQTFIVHGIMAPSTGLFLSSANQGESTSIFRFLSSPTYWKQSVGNKNETISSFEDLNAKLRLENVKLKRSIIKRVVCGCKTYIFQHKTNFSNIYISQAKPDAWGKVVVVA